MRQPRTTIGERAITVSWYAAAVVVFWSFGYTIMRGSDLWWHIAGGRWMVENGTLFVREPFAFTAAGQWWLNDAWLSGVLFHLWVEAFGLQSLAFWKWGLLIATWVVLFRVAARLAEDRTAAFIATTFGLAVAAPFLDVRPQLYSFLGFALVLDACVGRRPPAWLPLVFLLWANLHAGFVLGLAALPLLLLPAIIAEPSRWRPLALLGVACVLICFVNPNGAEVLVRPLRYAFDVSSPFRTLGEWRPPFEPGGIQSWLYPYSLGAFLGASVLVAVHQVMSGRPWRWDIWATVAVALLTLVLSLRSRRVVPFFAIAQTLVLAVVLARLSVAFLPRIPALLPPVLATVLGLYWLLPLPQRSYAFDYLTAYYEFPVETVNFIERNHLEGRVFNYYNWGGYLHMRTGGRLQVFIDGRADTVFADETFTEYRKVLHQQPSWQDVITHSGAEWVLWPLDAGTVVRELLSGSAWTLVSYDYKSALLRRADAPPLAPLQPTADSAYRQLATGWSALHDRNFTLAEQAFLQALAFEPHLPTACWNLARVQAYRERFADAYATVERCDGWFPGTQQRAWMLGVIERVEREGVPF